MIVNEISLKKLFTYTSSVYDIDGNFKGVKRENCKSKVKASTISKMMFASMMCGHSSINELNHINKNRTTRFNMLYNRREYIPRTHGLRDAIKDIDYHQIERINQSVIQKAKENKVFRKNRVDGLTVMAWDGVELSETKKNIEGLPEREYEDIGEIRKYIKYTCGMNVGPLANIMVISKQHLETEKVKTKSGKERSKTVGETTMFQNLWEESEKLIGGVIDVHVFDALYLNQNVMNLINESGKYFVIRLKDEKREIYEDSEGLFNNRCADKRYEIVETITVREIKYSKEAKKKDKTKRKIRQTKREMTDIKLGEKKLLKEETIIKKNSIIKEKVYEKVITRKEVWSDIFEITGYKGKVKVVKAIEERDKGKKQEIHTVTNMLSHDEETILKIMHLRWNIENNGFRTLKQRYNLEHIYIGEHNAINYIVQMIFLVFNLLELYVKIRLKEKIDITWGMVNRIFEQELHSNKSIKILLGNTS